MAAPAISQILWCPNGTAKRDTTAKAVLGWIGGATPDSPYVEDFNGILNNITDWLRWVKDEKTKEISNTADVIDIGVASATAVNIGRSGAITTIAGTTVATLTAPTIADFTNATHAHTNAASGGLIDHVSLSNKGTLTHATIDSYLDQAVKVASSPTFNAVNVTAAYTPRVDTGTATSLQIGTTNATGILIGKLGIATALQGTINIGTNEATDGVITIGNPTAEVHIVAGSFFAPSPVGLTSVNVDGGTDADAPILFNENMVNKYRILYKQSDNTLRAEDGIGTNLWTANTTAFSITGILKFTHFGTAVNSASILQKNGSDEVTGTTLTGTANQITITPSAGAITLSLPQSIHTTATPTFGTTTINGNISVTGTVDGVDVAGSINQGVKTTDSPTFANILVNGVLINSTTAGADWSSRYASLNAAIANIGGAEKTLYVQSDFELNANALLPANIKLVFLSAGTLTGAFTLTCADPYAKFQTASISNVTSLSGMLYVEPDWWVIPSLDNAINSSISGATIQLRIGRYEISAAPAWKDGLWLKGALKPRIKSDLTALEEGSIIIGPMNMVSPLQNMKFTDFGVDVGSYECARLYASVAQNGFMFAAPLPHAAPSVYSENIVIDNVQVLGKSSVGTEHAFLVEQGFNASITNINTYLCGFGVIIKCIHTYLKNISTSFHDAFGITIKSESYAPCAFVTLDGFYFQGNPGVSQVGLQIMVGDTVAKNITVRDFHCTNAAAGVQLVSVFAVPASSCSFIKGKLESCAVGFEVAAVADNLSLDSIDATACVVGLKSSRVVSSGVVKNCTFYACPSAAVFISAASNAMDFWDNIIGGTAGPSTDWLINGALTGRIGRNLPLTQTYNIVSGGFEQTKSHVRRISLTFLNSWQILGTGGFFATLDASGNVHITGVIRAGTSGTQVCLLPVGFRPTSVRRITTAAWSDAGETVQIPAVITIGTAGEFAAASAGFNHISVDIIFNPSL